MLQLFIDIEIGEAGHIACSILGVYICKGKSVHAGDIAALMLEIYICRGKTVDVRMKQRRRPSFDEIKACSSQDLMKFE